MYIYIYTYVYIYIYMYIYISVCVYIYMYIYIYMVGCILLTTLHGAPTSSYFEEAEDKVTTLQSGYSVCAVGL